MLSPKVSICIPVYDEMKNGAFFLERALQSIENQTFKDYELVITRDGKMAENTNSAIKKAKGEYIKILYQDDYLSSEYSLENMVNAFNDPIQWLIVGANNNLEPHFTVDAYKGNNHMGSPSALMFKNHFDDNLLFDENLSWLLDGELYKRMFEKWGLPSFLHGDYITIGEGDHQMTHILTDKEKLSEHEYMKKKYE